MFEVLRIADMKTVEGRQGSYLSFDLKHLLAVVEEEGPDLTWLSIPSAEGTWLTPRDGPKADRLLEFSDEVDRSETGVALTWTEIKTFGDSVFQTIWGTFVGVRDVAAFGDHSTLFYDSYRYLDRATERFYDLAEIAFQAVDSSFWLVWAKDPAVRDRFRDSFKAVETVAGMQRYEKPLPD